MIDFSKRIKNGTQAKRIDPIEIYNNLDRSSITGPLRPVQSNVLYKWHHEYREKRDAIIKLHTGAGKTLVGLLIAMSYINNGEGPVLYVCPNIYLMQQVCMDASKFGIPYCIVNEGNEIPDAFVQGKTLLISYVQKVFNGLSIFGTGNRSMSVGTIILDDSHACIESMIGSSTIQILRESPAYDQIYRLVEDDLQRQGSGTLQDIIHGRSNEMMPIPYWCWQDKNKEITSIISEFTSDNHIKFAWAMIKDQLEICNAYISSTKIEVCPQCLPIQKYGIFNNATHRILMSATTQEDTFFIKGLGLSVDAVMNPIVDEKYTWSGEKMILIPDAICENTTSEELLNRILQKQHDFGIAVLVPSFEKAKRYEDLGAVIANKTGSAKDMFTTLRDFITNHKNKVVVFANRYDGIDLPDDACRILIVDSVPFYDSLSDRYEEMCRSESEIIRIKTAQRIEQGLGRSVRGEKDYSVILVIGSDLIKYLRSIANRKYFSSQTQKQIEIGFDIVDMGKEDSDAIKKSEELELLFSTIDQCLTRDEGWKQYYSSMMDEIEDKAQAKSDIYSVLSKEYQAYNEMLCKNFDSAASIMQEIADTCVSESEKGWYIQEKAKCQYHMSHVDANKTQIAAFRKNNQLLVPISGIAYSKIKYPLDFSRNNRIIRELQKYNNYEELSIEIESILSSLDIGVEAEKAENAFYRIGCLLGYVSQRPDKEIRKGPDVLWCVSSGKYILIECKTEVYETRKEISKTEAGQVEEHCAWFESVYQGDTYIPILVIQAEKLADNAYFSREVRVLTKENLKKLKKQIRNFFKEFKGYNLKGIEPEVINQKLAAHNLHDNSFVEKVATVSKRKSQ